MPDYQNMAATEAVRHAKDVSGLTAEEIGAAAGLARPWCGAICNAATATIRG